MTDLRLEPLPEPEYAACLAEASERRLRLQMLPLYDDAEVARAQLARAFARLDPVTGASQLWRVVDGDRDAGWVLWRPAPVPGGDALLLDAVVDAPADGLLPALVELAGDAGNLLVDRMEGAETTTAIAEAGRLAPTASNMVLSLEQAPPESIVHFEPMSDARYAAWEKSSIVEYAADIEGSTTLGHEAAMAKSVKDFAEMLPQGRDTPENAIFDLRDDTGAAVGMVWLAKRSPTAYFVYDIVIDESVRGRGFGRAGMNAAAAWSRQQGGRVLGLNVFGKNAVARSLYLSLGYRVVVEEMVLPLTRP